jgi:asparagine synthase (glutamine-hydrolysing)
MCGILGVVGKGAGPQCLQTIHRSLASIAHRGPDGEDVFAAEGVAFGHRRLSIIDLTEGGRQPMTDAETGVTITFNGEIFNYVELRKELRSKGYVFHSQSDTEVLLRAYLEWGTACLRRLNGMFAFALFDPRENSVLLVRDRFGVKPLYYASKNGRLGFASESDALIGLGVAEARADEEAVANFLMAGRYAGERAFLSGVKSLPPAHVLVCDVTTGSITVNRWWDYPKVASGVALQRGDTFEAFAELFEDSVRLRLRSDVPLGVTLSGGLDSTAILAASARLNNRAPICFTSTYDTPGSGEFSWAEKAARAAGAEIVACPAQSDSWLETLDACIGHLGGPVATPAVVPLWRLMQQVRGSGIKVILEGQGADELLAGYVQYAVAALSFRRAGGPAVGAIPAMLSTFGSSSVAYSMLQSAAPGVIRALRTRMGYYAALTPEVRAACRDDLHRPRVDYQGRGLVDYRLWADHSGSQLARLLHYGDGISMAHGVESRMPFMDYRLVEWVFSLQETTRIDPARTKWMIRDYLKSRGQGEIAARKDKKGYPTPFTSWLAGPRAQALFADLPADSEVFGYVVRDKFMELLSDQRGGNDAGANLRFRIVTLQLWLDRLKARRLAASRSL